jgi:diaminohydroxyphosphoribosylaminopyrimidine deaminase/5-amino-6-(5-phosphoribosylamino)uracil reductase
MAGTDESYMHRCIELAKLGMGRVAPNPMVGAVLVYGERIIGEGYHEQYGQAHAEVNCINSVAPADIPLIPDATLYVSLEPCVHFGKTPPCCDLIIEKKIKKVVIGCRDPFEEVNGKGIEKLQKAGVDVVTGILEDVCWQVNKRFFTFHTKQRPYIILKWAQTANGKIGSDLQERLLISNENTNRLVHQWRSEEASILIGTHTALLDDPSLDNRLWSGRSPVRMVLDMPLRLPHSLKLFNRQQTTIIFNRLRQEEDGNILYCQLTDETHIIQQVLAACYKLKLQSILVEGGAKLLQSFINESLWDEARVITNDELMISSGLHAPLLQQHYMIRTEKIFSDTIHYYINKQKAES